MTEFLDKDELLKSLKCQIECMNISVAHYASNNDYKRAAEHQEYGVLWKIMVNDIERGVFSIQNPEPAPEGTYKAAVLEILKTMEEENWESANKAGADKQWAAMNYFLGAHGGLKAAANKIRKEKGL